MSTAAEVTALIEMPNPQRLKVDLRMDHFGEWTAEVRGVNGCIGDGATKQDAISAAIELYYHVVIRRLQRREISPRMLKNVVVEDP